MRTGARHALLGGVLCAALGAAPPLLATAREAAPASPPEPALIPRPASLERGAGEFVVRTGTPVRVESAWPEAIGIARGFAERLAASRGLRVDLAPRGARAERAAIVFALNPSLPSALGDEGYSLAVDAHGIRVAARAPAGLFYGGVTLWQLLTQDFARTDAITLPALRIDDAPRFAWRGALLDSAR
ncbi:MAG TPA: glycoside hydrolase family 20 zincin-like fold domain-containing protein, partial [Dokdonella sp.]